MQVTDLVYTAEKYVMFSVFAEDKSVIQPILHLLTGNNEHELSARCIQDNERYRHLLSRLTVQWFLPLMDCVIVFVDQSYDEAKELLTND